MESRTYLVTCCTAGCDWRDQSDTEFEARLLGLEHAGKNPFHTTVVVSPEQEVERAA